MLKAITIENFILFRDRQRLDLSLGPNFIIGANGTGKSSIFELVRRCLSQKHNKSISNVHTKSRTGFVVCEYDISSSCIKSSLKDYGIELKDGPLYTIMFSKYDTPSSEEGHIFKLVLSIASPPDGDNAAVFSQVCISDSRSSTCGNPITISMADNQKTNIVKQLHQFINDITRKENCDTTVKNIVKVLTECMSSDKPRSPPKRNKKQSECELILEELAKSVIFVFGKRSIDPVQTSHSRRRLSPSYEYTQKSQAEILVDLLQSKDLDEGLERKFFTSLIFPQEYEFQVTNSEVMVINKSTDLRTSLIKTSDGIVEAKQLSLLVCNKSYGTIFLQSPEKGMHPPMIKKFRDLVLKRITDKTVVVSSHHQSIITNWTLPLTFMCHFKKSERERGVQGETSVVPCSALSPNAMNDDELKTIPFSEYVLFVEGISDKKVLRQFLYRLQKSIADHDFQCPILKNVRTPEKLCNFITLLNIIAQDGCKNHFNNKTICEMLGVPCIFVYDKDVFISKDNKLMSKALPSYCERKGTEEITKLIGHQKSNRKNGMDEKATDKLCEILSDRHSIFMWKKGKIEDAVEDAKNPFCDKDHMKDKEKKKISYCSLECIEQMVEEIIKGESREWRRFLVFIEKTADNFIRHCQGRRKGSAKKN